MGNEPKNLTIAEMESIIERLKAEGRLPSQEKIREVLAKLRQEYQPKIMAAREASATPNLLPAPEKKPNKELQYLAIPGAKYPLAEINLPPNLVKSCDRRFLKVRLLRGTENSPKCALFRAGSRDWFFPKRWLSPVSAESPLDSVYEVTCEVEFAEQLILPTFHDLLEINFPKEVAADLASTQVAAHIRLVPNKSCVFGEAA